MARRLARLPRTLHLLGYRIDVRQLDKRTFDGEWGDESDAMWEEHLDEEYGTIYVRRALPIREKRRLFLHELVHAANDLARWEAL